MLLAWLPKRFTLPGGTKKKIITILTHFSARLAGRGERVSATAAARKRACGAPFHAPRCSRAVSFARCALPRRLVLTPSAPPGWAVRWRTLVYKLASWTFQFRSLNRTLVIWAAARSSLVAQLIDYHRLKEIIFGAALAEVPPAPSVEERCLRKETLTCCHRDNGGKQTMNKHARCTQCPRRWKGVDGKRVPYPTQGEALLHARFASSAASSGSSRLALGILGGLVGRALCRMVIWGPGFYSICIFAFVCEELREGPAELHDGVPPARECACKAQWQHR